MPSKQDGDLKEKLKFKKCDLHHMACSEVRYWKKTLMRCKQYNLNILLFFTLCIASMQIKIVKKIELSWKSFSVSCWSLDD